MSKRHALWKLATSTKRDGPAHSHTRPLRCCSLFSCCLLLACSCTLYLCRYGYSLCAWSVDEYRPLCRFVSLVWPLHLHGSVLNRCSVTNTHCAPLLSLLSFSLSYILYSFSLFCVSSVLVFSIFIFPFFGFLFLLCLLLSIIICVNPSFLPSSFFHSLSLLLKMMPLIKRMVRSSHSASPATIYSCFSFFFLFFSLASFQSTTPYTAFSCHVWPQRPLLSAFCSTLICITVPLNTSWIKLITHLRSSFASLLFVFNIEMV